MMGAGSNSSTSAATKAWIWAWRPGALAWLISSSPSSKGGAPLPQQVEQIVDQGIILLQRQMSFEVAAQFRQPGKRGVWSLLSGRGAKLLTNVRNSI